MPPNHGLDWRDSNVELVGSDLDHKVKYNSAATEPAWQGLGEQPGLRVWRIENFQVVAWPEDKYGQFHEGDSYICVHSFKLGDKLGHDIFFWLGSKTTQDEAGTAAYKAVELDEFLHGVATQHRELQREPSDDFAALFPRIRILAGGVRSGFTHVDTDTEEPEDFSMLLRVFKHPTSRRADAVIVHEVEPQWQSLDENDVFILQRPDKIWVWQGKKCSPMEKAKAAQVVHDLTLAKHIDVEVLSEAEARSRTIVSMLGGDQDTTGPFQAARPMAASRGSNAAQRPRKLFRLSDEAGKLQFNKVREGSSIGKGDLVSDDVFVLDTGSGVWVWQGAQASKAEKAAWIRVAESYVRSLEDDTSPSSTAYLAPISKVVEGHEPAAFLRALEA
ncbi:putative actin-binding protein Fragmin [Microdochium trichocladiopsis]|uniref:Actin-binding protein Fragmin n=1 Tax=Microdochium trichocladiopsis TaxID=1682393 RepID=A0A9P8Y2N8_9PEZI|nr:putative actin-binding protein Fragmin [Microdochium trichocladiopsis]KAH7029324.1 putative actin-binding protein Fragmin [Microdochium trichocladiopsis]